MGVESINQSKNFKNGPSNVIKSETTVDEVRSISPV